MADISTIAMGGQNNPIKDAEARRQLQVLDRLYNGVDLTVKFATEIKGYATPWAWIQARIKAAKFTEIHVGDYIPFALTDGKTFKAEIAGIDTYYNYGDAAVGHHIDFITRDCHPDTHVFNKVNYNNGLAAEKSPWLVSDLYAWLNSKAMDVPNGTTADPATVAVNYTATGVLDKIPAALSAVIIEKRALVPIRYAAGLLLTDDNGWEWKNLGKLWIPFEVEMYGCGMWGSMVPATPGHSIGGFVQYPLFAQNMRRIKGAGDGGSRAGWWLGSAGGGGSTNFAIVATSGTADTPSATYTGVRAAFGFRIA